jgi:hypothetical protein
LGYFQLGFVSSTQPTFLGIKLQFDNDVFAG